MAEVGMSFRVRMKWRRQVHGTPTMLAIDAFETPFSSSSRISSSWPSSYDESREHPSRPRRRPLACAAACPHSRCSEINSLSRRTGWVSGTC